MSTSDKKFKALVGKSPSGWLKAAQWREDNSYWLKQSQHIALKILVTLKKRGMTKDDLNAATKISKAKLNKMVKGSHDFSLKEIRRLEDALGIKFLVELYDDKEPDIQQDIHK